MIAEQLVAAILGAAITGPASGGISAIRSKAYQELEAQLLEKTHAALKAKEALQLQESVGNVVYQSVTAAGQVQYVGITNNLARRAAEHLSSKGIQVEKVLTGLSRQDARAVEQTLIEIHGLGKNGGTLLNKINSISPKNPDYAKQLSRGYELLERIGYNGLPLD